MAQVYETIYINSIRFLYGLEVILQEFLQNQWSKLLDSGTAPEKKTVCVSFIIELLFGFVSLFIISKLDTMSEAFNHPWQ